MKDYYSIYPKYNHNIKKISIKLFLNMKNPEIFKIFPINFCKIRNCYVFDIKKSKFPFSKKLLRFNFIINNEIVLISPYKTILFGDNYVNQVDFNDYGKNFPKQRKKIVKYNLIKSRNKKEKTIESDIDSDSDFACINLQRPPAFDFHIYKSLDNTSFKKYKKYSKQQKKMNLAQSQKSITMKSTFMSENDTLEDINSSKPKLKRIRSILKMSKRDANFLSRSTDCLMKKVSFGVVKYSY